MEKKYKIEISFNCRFAPDMPEHLVDAVKVLNGTVGEVVMRFLSENPQFEFQSLRSYDTGQPDKV